MVNALIRAAPFFAGLSDDELNGLGNSVIERQFSKNQTILREEDTSKYMYIVYSGKVKVVQVSEDGKEQILSIHKAGDFFGEMSLLDGKTSPAAVVAMEDVRIGLISKQEFEFRVLKNDRLLREVLFFLCARLREAWARLKVLGLASAEEKVRAVLKLLSIQSGIKDRRGTIIPMNLTHEVIAGYASVSRETVSRLLSRFLKEGEIEILEDRCILLRPGFFERTFFV